MTAIYLAYSASGESRHTLPLVDWDECDLGLLVSFFYIDQFNRCASQLRPRRTMLDSGAYSAYNSGKTIDPEALIQETQQPRWGESVALDVIGDGEASLRNALYMKSRGSPAYPVFHIGESLDLLREYKREFPKVGLSCRFGEPVKESYRFLDRCFAVAWPYKFHSFGWVSEEMLLRYPFHTADAASWLLGPAAFGRWSAYGRSKNMALRKFRDLRSEVDVYAAMQRKVRARWKSEFEKQQWI